MVIKSLQLRLAIWFTASVLLVSGLFATITYLHLRHELRFEQWQRVHPENPDFVLHGTYSEKEIHDIAGHILHISLIISIPVALLALLLGRYLAHKSLRPVASINSQLQQIEAQRLDSRLHTPDADAELQTITRNINALLERIENNYREVAEFSARVAHELRTPLTLMRLQLEDSSSKIDPVLAENLQDELSHLGGYVEQCLLIARAERRQIEVTLKPFRLLELINDILEPFKLLAKAQQRELIWEPSCEVEVSAAPWILRQILHNLLSNALKHGQAVIHIELQQLEQAALIVISNPKAATEQSSTGLGLRIVEALVRAHGSMRFEKTSSDTEFRTQLYIEAADTPD